jgi:O-Antigen ligase
LTARTPAAVAVAALLVAVLRPPEISPPASAFIEILAAAALVLLVLRPSTLSRDARHAALLILPLAVGAVWLAAARARALDEAALLAQFIIFVALGVAVAGEPGLRRALPALLMGLGALAAGQAIAQHHWAWPHVAAELRAQGPPGDAVTDAMLVRLESGRPSGPFILPTALAGFLAITIPATLLLALGGAQSRAGRMRLARAIAVAALLVQSYAFLLTRSLGGLVALGCGLMLLIGIRSGGPARRTLATLMVLLAAGFASVVFLRARQGEMTSAPGADPVSLRAGNWRVAVAMVREHPLFGVGPGSFGTFYPRYMQAGMNETRYAHNSYLQLVSTWGLWILLPIGAALVGLAFRLRRFDPGGDGRLAAVAGGTAFLVHNLIDFTFYQPGVAVPGALLLGVAAAHITMPVADRYAETSGATPRRARLLFGCAAALMLAGHGVLAARASMLLDRAQAAASRGDRAAAREDAQRAARARPGDPRPWAFLSELEIAGPGDDPAALRAGRAAAERAVALDPESAVRHHVLALYHAHDDERAAAWLEERRAHELFPLKPLYRDAVPAGPAP